MTKVYSYAACGTCKKALKWLDSRGIEFEVLPIVDNPPTKKELKSALTVGEYPINKLFNTSGQIYRQGNYKEKLKTMSESEALAELASQGKLIKRPFIVGDGFVLVGFKEEAWAEHF